MIFPVSRQLMQFDVFPKVVTAQKEVTIRVRSIGKMRFNTEGAHAVEIFGLDDGDPVNYPAASARSACRVTATPEDDTTLVFTHTFPAEQEYFIRLLDHAGNCYERFSVYCVDEDLAGRYPYRGDLHLHSCRSDGDDLPALVASDYRAYGYDFLALTDHCRYYPSLEAMDFCRGIKTGLLCVPGEEVNLPGDGKWHLEQHIVNFGGTYSINALLDGEAIREKGEDPVFRSLDGKCPPVMTLDTFHEMIEQKAAQLDIPDRIDPISYATAKWVYEEIRKADGLAIFAHPNWITQTYHTPENLSDLFVKNHDFDAFEVLGGERYNQQNGFQTYRYYEDRANGYRYPIVGSTDSHCSCPTNIGGQICSTVVFSKEKERKAIISAIKDFYSVAVDTISAEFRLVGEARLCRYTDFLVREYFPIHDSACCEEGRMMRQFATGTAEEKEQAARVLEALDGRTDRLLHKYFAFA